MKSTKNTYMLICVKGKKQSAKFNYFYTFIFLNIFKWSFKHAVLRWAKKIAN